MASSADLLTAGKFDIRGAALYPSDNFFFFFFHPELVSRPSTGFHARADASREANNARRDRGEGGEGELEEGEEEEEERRKKE